MRQGEKGLTLIEMMVVIMLIGMLTVVLGRAVWTNVRKAKADLTRQQLEELRQQLELYNLNEKRYPAALADLAKPSKALLNEPYLKGTKMLKDQWGNEISYRAPGSGGKPFDLVSYGSDGQPRGEGEAADLSVWDEE